MGILYIIVGDQYFHTYIYTREVHIGVYIVRQRQIQIRSFLRLLKIGQVFK